MFGGSSFDKVPYRRMPTVFERLRYVTTTAELTISSQASARGVVPEATFRLSRAEHLEMIYASAGIGIAECPAWVLVALDRHETMEPSRE